MKSAAGWLAGGLGIYLIALVIAAPASRVLALLSDGWEPFSVSGASGNLLAGSARLHLGGEPLVALEWRATPGRLATGCLEYRIRPIGLDVFSPPRPGRGGFCADGSAYLAAFELGIDAARVARWAVATPLELRGAMNLRVDSLTYRDGRFVGGGQLTWHDAELGPMLEPIRLQTVTMPLTSERGAITAILTHDAGDLEMSGRVQLDGLGRYWGEVRLRPRPAASATRWPAPVAASPDGSMQLNWQGQLRAVPASGTDERLSVRLP